MSSSAKGSSLTKASVARLIRFKKQRRKRCCAAFFSLQLAIDLQPIQHRLTRKRGMASLQFDTAPPARTSSGGSGCDVSIKSPRQHSRNMVPIQPSLRPQVESIFSQPPIDLPTALPGLLRHSTPLHSAAAAGHPSICRQGRCVSISPAALPESFLMGIPPPSVWRGSIPFSWAPFDPPTAAFSPAALPEPHVFPFRRQLLIRRTGLPRHFLF